MFQKIIFLPLVARILLALLFILAGINKIGGFAGTSGYIASKGLPVPDVLAVLTIIVEIGGGALLVIGYRTRWAALALAVFSILAALIFHNFWTMQGAAANLNQVQFMKNLSIAGGMLALVYFGAGPLAADRSK